MPTITAVRGMLNTDFLRMIRDRFLVGITVYGIVVYFAMRAAIPWITHEVASAWDFDLVPYHPLIVSYLVVQLAPLFAGFIGGFVLLETKEENVVKALLVSPSSLANYLSVACVVMVVVAFLSTVAAAVLIGLALPSWPAVIAVALAAAPAAPIFALLIAAFADNKVQAFAYSKIFGLGPVVVAGAWFLPESWQWLVAIYPPYWASKAFWVAEAGGAWALWAVGGLISSAIWIAILGNLFHRAART